jgi:hypothetical protein
MKLEIEQKEPPDGNVTLILELGDMACEIDTRFEERGGYTVAMSEPYSRNRVEVLRIGYHTVDEKELATLPPARQDALKWVRGMAWSYLKQLLKQLQHEDAETPMFVAEVAEGEVE